MVIWKLQLRMTEMQLLSMPEKARVLSVGEQYGKPCLWFACDPDHKRVSRRILMVGTGHSYPLSHFVGTIKLHDGDLMLHIFDDGEIHA